MASCAFFGHRHLHVENYKEKLLALIVDLIENKGVTQFYSGYRGQFDYYCSELIHKLKDKYPHIKNTMVLSYIPQNKPDAEYPFELPKCFDDSVYLLERRVPLQFAIIETNKCLVDKVDYIISSVVYHRGGAYTVLQYARRKKKPILTVIDDWDGDLS